MRPNRRIMNAWISLLNQIREGRSIVNRKSFATMVCAFALVFTDVRNAQALTVITGTVGSAGKYLLTGSPVNVTANAVLKISFEDATPGTNVELCAGTAADFAGGNCPTRLSDSGGPGFTFLTIVDAASLNGKILYVIRAVGAAAASFVFTIE
jgi:hypothetical protein